MYEKQEHRDTDMHFNILFIPLRPVGDFDFDYCSSKAGKKKTQKTCIRIIE